MNSIVHERLREILNRAYQEDWDDTSFSVKKAYICAELSSIVYLDVAEHELKSASRIHLFASDTYRGMIESGKTFSISNELNQSNFDAQFFIVRGRYSIVLGIKLRDVVILAIRGTVSRKLWDWKANLDAEKYYVDRGVFSFFPFEFNVKNLDQQFFHRGFFESIIPQFSSIKDEISRLTNSSENVKIVWTGHSLGGAMAATAFAINSLGEKNIFLNDPIPHKSVSAYTFGMPRYCGLGSVLGFPSPYHIYRKADLIPTLPLRKMGFCDIGREYEISESGILAPTVRTDTFGFFGHLPRLLTSIKAHSIEGYVELLKSASEL